MQWLPTRARSERPSPGSRRRDRRAVAILATACAIGSGGLVLQSIPPAHRLDVAVQTPPTQAAGLPATGGGSGRGEVHARFQQAVAMLRAGQHEHALAALHRVMELAPQMPEAHVNMGFALLGLGRFAAARDFFESATVLRPEQSNAYYGLAIALEAMHDISGARGAMRAYLHLAPHDAPQRRRARAALWEWEGAAGARPHAGPDAAVQPR